MVVLAPTSNVCLRVEDPDGVQEEHMRFILVRAEKCPTSSGGGEFCIILHRSACSRANKRVREEGAPKSQGVSGECVCDSAGALARSRRVICSCVCLFFSFFPLLERSLYAPFIVSRRCRVIKCWYGCDPCWRRSPEASRGPYPVATWSVL
jgi:hypothetical protein